MEQKYSRSGYPSDHRKQITAYVFHLPQFTLLFETSRKVSCVLTQLGSKVIIYVLHINKNLQKINIFWSLFIPIIAVSPHFIFLYIKKGAPTWLKEHHFNMFYIHKNLYKCSYFLKFVPKLPPIHYSYKQHLPFPLFIFQSIKKGALTLLGSEDIIYVLHI